MAVCKTCGCAIPIGRKSCDMCAAVGAVAPAQQAWSPPKEAAAPQELSSSAASWAAASGAARSALPTDLKKAEKKVREAWQFIAAIGLLNIGVGILAEAAGITALLNYFDWFSVGVGVVFLVLAYFIRGGSMVAMGSRSAFTRSTRSCSSGPATSPSSASSSWSFSSRASARLTSCGSRGRQRPSSNQRPVRISCARPDPR